MGLQNPIYDRYINPDIWRGGFEKKYEKIRWKMPPPPPGSDNAVDLFNFNFLMNYSAVLKFKLRYQLVHFVNGRMTQYSATWLRSKLLELSWIVKLTTQFHQFKFHEYKMVRTTAPPYLINYELMLRRYNSRRNVIPPARKGFCTGR